MFRSEEDINFFFNCFAVACLETESRPVADSEMTTHTHLGVCTDNAKTVLTRLRYPYSRYFNNKYERKGRLGEKYPFFLEVDGILHSQTLLTYIFRQGLHHGLSDTPYGYKHNSASTVFQKFTGKESTAEILSRSHMAKFLPCPTRYIPDNYRMSKQGLLLREDVIDTAFVEELYISPRNFLYQMNRITTEEWINEQKKDNNGLPPVTLDLVEPPCFKGSISDFLINESGRNFRGGITDLELCSLIDYVYIPRLGRKTIYELNDSERRTLGNRIYTDIRNLSIAKSLGRNPGRPDEAQIRRCVIL